MEEGQTSKVILSPSPLQPKAAEEEEPLPRPSPCDECGVQLFKYRCPGCSLRTCSLPCVKSHKQRTNCNGKRDRTHFIPLSEFNDAQLISDYNLLEETKRVAESARTLRQGLIGNAGFKLSLKAKELRRVARTRKIDVLLMPAGMTMRKKNRSYYHRCQYHATNIMMPNIFYLKGLDCGFSNEEESVRIEMLQDMSSFDSEGRYIEAIFHFQMTLMLRIRIWKKGRLINLDWI